MTRPKKDEQTVRSNSIHIRMNDTEYELLQKRASAVNMSMAEFIRNALDNQQVTIKYELVADVPEIKKLLKPNSVAVVLIKPQFECGREFLSRSGIVKNPKVHKNVIKSTVLEANSAGLSVIGLTNSPIKGGDGNTEYL